jgi:hypothetical protein
MPDQEQQEPLIFPTAGINLITEFEQQLPNTTSVALNVRGWEPATQRNRGGSRQGISKWIDSQVPGTAALIQDLNQLVTLDATALLTGFGLDIFPGESIPNPNNPQFIIPRFGSGVQLNRNTGTTLGPSISGFVGVSTSGGTGPTFLATLEVGAHNQTVTNLSGTGNVASGFGLVAIKVGTTIWFQLPLFVS